MVSCMLLYRRVASLESSRNDAGQVNGLSGWVLVGQGRLIPVSGNPPPETEKLVKCWRCTTGDLWVEEARSPPETVHTLQQLSVFLHQNGYMVALLPNSSKETVLLSKNTVFRYELLPDQILKCSLP